VEHAFAFSTPFAYVPSQHLEVPRPIQEAIARLQHAGNDTVIYELS
jgi:Nup133 N terminal like